MNKIIPEFLVNADNVYRTKHFIVKQVLVLESYSKIDNHILSHDTFYARTKKRDRQYEFFYDDKTNINGKRLPATMYSRKYVK